MTTATFGTIARRSNGTIEVPVILNKNISNLSRSHFQVASASGDGADGISDIRVYGSGTAYQLILAFFENKAGEVNISTQRQVRDGSGSESLMSSPN